MPVKQTFERRDPTELKSDKEHDPNDPLYLEIVAWIGSGQLFPGNLSPLAIFDDWGLMGEEERQLTESHCRKRNCIPCFRWLQHWDAYSFDSLLDYDKLVRYDREWYVAGDGTPSRHITSRWSASPLIAPIVGASRDKASQPPDKKPGSPKPVPDGQCVYFIISQALGVVKIGTSRDPDARLKSLQTGSPDVLVLALTIPGGVELEAELHTIFAASRTHGEWFNLTDDTKEFIKRMEAENNG